MKILALSNLYPPNVKGGYEVGCAVMLKQLSSMGHEITVLTARGASDFNTTDDGTGVRRVLTFWDTYNREPTGDALSATILFHGRVIDLTNVALILEELCANDYDVVYCFNLEGLGALAICDLLTDLRVPWVWHLMDCIPRLMIHDLRPEIGALFSTYANRRVGASCVIAMSQRLLGEIAQVGLSMGDSISVIPGWAPEPRAPTRPRSPDRLALTSVGVVCEEKGADLIIDALRLLEPSVLERVSVDFFGRGDLGTYRSKVAQLGLSSHVRFRGQVSHHDVLTALPEFDGLLFPTWKREPFGFVALEAAVNGLTPVFTCGIGAAEVLADGVHSVQIERDAAELSKVIADAVNNPDRFRSIGQRASSHVKSNYLLPFMARRVENELLAVAEPIRVGRDLAQKFLAINRFKYRFSREHVIAVTSPSPTDPLLAESHRRLQHAGRSISKGIVRKLLRWGMLKITWPFFMEILANQRKMDIRMQSMTDRIDSFDVRFEKYLNRNNSDQEPR
jgi:glycogen(starch) synthase